MVVSNCHRTTAIVIRHEAGRVTLVPMAAGRLSAQTLSFADFRREWAETGYPLERALDSFLHHAQAQGASAEVTRGLARLQQRDALVASLF